MPTQYLLMEACHFHELPILFPSKSHLRKFLSTDNLCCCFQNKINFVCHIFFGWFFTSPRDFGGFTSPILGLWRLLTNQFSRNWGYKTWILFEREEPRWGQPISSLPDLPTISGGQTSFSPTFSPTFSPWLSDAEGESPGYIIDHSKLDTTSWPFLSHAHVNPTHSHGFCIIIY